MFSFVRYEDNSIWNTMKVIKDNYNKDVQYECFWCQSILEVNDKDIKVDAAGDEYFVCPLCGQKTFI